MECIKALTKTTKAGHYGRFYGEVDPMVITCALREFMKDKNLIVEQEERKS